MNTGMLEFINKSLGEDKFPDLTNDEVVILYKRGQADFNQVLLRYNALIIKKSREFVPGHTEEDVYQELCMRLVHCLDLWNEDGGTKFITYLSMGLHNQLAWMVRKNYGSEYAKSDCRRINFGELASYEVEVENGYDIPDYKMDAAISNILLTDVLDKAELSEEERICVNLLWEGKKKCEVAEIMHKSPRSIGKMVKRLEPKIRLALS